MTDQNTSDDLPPDLPPEYAEAYRRGYERAYRASNGDPEPAEMAEFDDLFDAASEPEPWTGPTHRAPAQVAEKPAWFVPVLLGTLVMLLVLGAYGAGRLLSDQVASGPKAEPQGVVMPADSPSKKPAKPRPTTKPAADAWDGSVKAVDDFDAEVGCALPDGTDAGGHKIAYGPDKMHDGDFSTAWRCSGDGRGVTIRLSFGEAVRIAEVGLVPGYAKTDPRSHTDRYAENNRITRVRWSLGGRSVVQRLDGSAGNRELQTLRIEPVETDQVSLELLSSTPGARNTVAISELRIAEADG